MSTHADRLAVDLATAGILALGLGVLAIIADISLRHALGISIVGAVDLTQLAQLWCVALVLPLTFLRESNITIDFVTARFPQRWLAALRATVQLLCAVFLFALTFYGAQQAYLQIAQGDVSQTIGIALVWYWAPLLCGLFLSGSATLLLAWHETQRTLMRTTP